MYRIALGKPSIKLVALGISTMQIQIIIYYINKHNYRLILKQYANLTMSSYLWWRPIMSILISSNNKLIKLCMSMFPA